jgi:hypothetical protein
MSSLVTLAPDVVPVARTTPELVLDPAPVAVAEAPAAPRKKCSTGRCEALVAASAAAFLATASFARRIRMYSAVSFDGLSVPEPRR